MLGKRMVWILSMMATAAAASSATSIPVGVSPGDPAEFLKVADPCPTFNWSAAEGATGYELAIYMIDETDEASAQTILRERIDGAALGWTPPLARCLEAGRRYAWSVRALAAAGETGWSAPRLFSVAAPSSKAELAAALEVVQRFLDAESGDVYGKSEDLRTGTGAFDSSARSEGTGVAAVHGENATTTGDAIGVAGTTSSLDGAGLVAANQAGGADLRLDAGGGTDTTVTEAGIFRSSVAAETFEIGNPQGELTLTIDGVTAVTTATDRDTLGDIGCTNGELAKWNGSAWVCAPDDDTLYLSGNQLELSGTTFDVVEGPSSGLDADTVDGIQASAFASVAHAHSGVDIVSGTIAEPRIAADIARDNEIFATVLASDGSGSNLDADTLDGLHASDLQAQVNGSCPPIHAMVGVESDGTPVCLEIPVPPWTRSFVEAGACPEGPSIAQGTDSFGVSAHGVTGGGLEVLKCFGNDCNHYVFSTVDATQVGNRTSIAIGADGFPVISYQYITDGDLKVAKCNDPACTGGDETLSTVDVIGAAGWDSSIAIPGDGLPVISYTGSPARLSVAKCNDPGCTGNDETLTALDTIVSYSSIAIGSDGWPVIAYTKGGADTDLLVAKCNDAVCSLGATTLTTVDSIGSVGSYPSIVVGNDGNPLIAYYDGTNGDLKVAWCQDLECASTTITSVDSLGDVGLETSIALGSNDGFPVISYHDATLGDLKVARCQDSGCVGSATISAVNWVGIAGYQSAIAMGADGFPMITWLHGPGCTVNYMKCRNPSCRY